MSCSYTEEELRDKTREYWRYAKREGAKSKNKVMEFYITRKLFGDKSLLEVELEYIGKATVPAKTLVLLVGHSFEPLFQSLCFYRPQRLLLVMNEKGYGDISAKQYAVMLRNGIELLNRQGLLEREQQTQGGPCFESVADDPSAVFATLVENLREEAEPVIDITGGKKSMVAGAFLYAAYAKAKISYVDFSDYDESEGRPYGYNSRIKELGNPHVQFAIREWEEIRRFYQQYQFRDARTVLKSVRQAMTEVFPSAVAALEKLEDYLVYYELWDQGDYREAWKKQQQFGDNVPRLPSAVEILGPCWYEIEGGAWRNFPKHLYGEQRQLIAYVYDELSRIDRLIRLRKEYRSAFLRAAALSEVINLARLVAYIRDEPQRETVLQWLDARTPGARVVFNELTDRSISCIEIRCDRKNNGRQEITLKGRKPGETCKKDSIIVQRPAPMKRWWQRTTYYNEEQGWTKFLDTRNHIAHKYFPVPQELAKDAWRFVKANYEDFLEGSNELAGDLKAEAIPWRKLCEVCGLGEFLPAFLLQDGSEVGDPS